VADPFGSAAGVLAGVAVGGAATVALQPAFEIPRQDAWSRNANRILDVDLLARLVAQGGIDLSSAEDEAKRDGFGPDKLDALVYMAQTVPGFAEALDLWRRGLISDDLMSHTLVKAGLDQRYAGPLLQLKEAALVGLGDIATAIVRGALPSPSYMPVSPPTSGLSVPRFPQVPLDPEALAAKLGFDPEMLQLMVARSGLSLAPIFAANAFFRGIINDNDFLLAIAEGDLRTEWAETLKESAREIITAEMAMEGVLRGWWDKPTGYALAARHGMTQADADRIYQIRRRPLSPHQIKQALARGASFNPEAGEITDPYSASVHQANLGPEWYEMAIALQGSYPSIFVTNRLVTGGTISPDTGRTFLEKAGNANEVVTALHDSWTGTSSTTANKDVTSAQTKLKTRTHSSYVAGEIDDPTATAALTAAGVAATAIPAILALWQAERALIRKQLSPTQIRKAVSGAVTNPATGQPWSEADAMAALLARGYDQNDATTFLAEG